MCSGSETGPYLRLVDFAYYSTRGVRVIEKAKKSGASQRQGDPPILAVPVAAVERTWHIQGSRALASTQKALLDSGPGYQSAKARPGLMVGGRPEEVLWTGKIWEGELGGLGIAQRRSEPP